MIKRCLQNTIVEKIGKGKAIIILGSRQVGKSTLLKQVVDTRDESVIYLDCDNNDIKKALTDVSINQLKRIIGKSEIVIIDEAQRVKNIGLSLKIITDQLKSIQLIVSGSSSFDLSNKVNEPLTGRKFEYNLFPFSLKELVDHYGFLDESRNLEIRIIFGMYTDVININGD
ncbi:MAG: AAA family ATPase [Flavobacteriaceae bacterium]|nr:AAA family ATPase [Flavobacteriaceae bacterium]